MSYIEIYQDDSTFKRWLAVKARHKLRGKLVKCSYPYQEEKDGQFKTVQPDCPYGKGIWCSICQHHSRYKFQTGQSKGMYKTNKLKSLASYNKNLVAPNRKRKMGQTNPLMITKYGTKSEIKEMKMEDRR